MCIFNDIPASSDGFTQQLFVFNNIPASFLDF